MTQLLATRSRSKWMGQKGTAGSSIATSKESGWRRPASIPPTKRPLKFWHPTTRMVQHRPDAPPTRVPKRGACTTSRITTAHEHGLKHDITWHHANNVTAFHHYSTKAKPRDLRQADYGTCLARHKTTQCFDIRQTFAKSFSLSFSASATFRLQGEVEGQWQNEGETIHLHANLLHLGTGQATTNRIIGLHFFPHRRGSKKKPQAR